MKEGKNERQNRRKEREEREERGKGTKEKSIILGELKTKVNRRQEHMQQNFIHFHFRDFEAWRGWLARLIV